MGRSSWERGLVCVAVALVALALPAVAHAMAAKPFGIAAFALQTTREAGGGPPSSPPGMTPYGYTQAGGSPDALTIEVRLDSETAAGGQIVPTRDLRDMAIDLPPGLSADPGAALRCPAARVLAGERCPADTQVGVYQVALSDGRALFGPIVDVAPQPGEVGQLAFELPTKASLLANLFLTVTLAHASAGYGLRIAASGLPEAGVLGIEASLWGAPAAEDHDPSRGLFCIGPEQAPTCEGGGERAGVLPQAFLSMPGDCAAGPAAAIAYADSWEEPGRWVSAESSLPPPTGCAQLSFSPSLDASFDTPLADEAAGLTLGLSSLQPEGPEAATTSPLRLASVTLPPGVSLNPAAAQGLLACAATGPQGIDMPGGAGTSGQQPDQAGEGEAVGPEGLSRLAPGHCPQASRIGAVEASTPLLARPLTGSLYLAQPLCGGAGQAACTPADVADGGLLRVYLELSAGAEPDAEGVIPAVAEPGDGVVVKLAGYVEVDPATGQLTLRIPEAPQLPLGSLTISLAGGPRTLLANPASCGVATTTSDLSPWSAPGLTPEGLLVSGTPDATPSSSYQVTGCLAGPAFSPGFLAGTLTPAAGAFSPLTMAVSRGDREQLLTQVQVQAPPGLFANLTGVTQCGSAQAAAAACPGSSRIGDSAILAGAGPAPLEVPGAVYLTGPYQGAPFGLAIVTAMTIGPFDLGPLTVRAAVAVDPESGALTITTDPLPRILDGIPLRLRRLSIDIDRPRFVFNPTSCDAKQISATVAGAQGAVAEAASPFAASGCRGLAFDPQIEAAVRLPHSRGHTGGRRRGRAGGGAARIAASSDGASLDMRLSFPAAARGTQANLARISLVLPRQLPSRLQALRHACPGRIFAADPAACPSGSVVGIVKAVTPALPGTLAGPVYFVSHGAGGYPVVVAVLQGDGVQLRLTGAMRVASKQRIGVDFSALPDVPIRRVQLYLPAGPNSALGAAKGVCAAGGRLSMPVTLAAQNGAVVSRTVRVALAGCHSGA